MIQHTIHIGLHKTATTWLQEGLFPAVRNYRCVPEQDVEEIFLNVDALAFDPEAAWRRLRDLGGESHPLIVSQEELSGNPHNGGLYGCFSKDVAMRIAATVPNPRIVIVLREQVDMIATVYKQYIHDGGTHRPRRYLYPHAHRGGAFRRPYKLPTFRFEHFDYAARIRFYDSIFGRDNVKVYLYEDFRQDGQAFVERMADDLGFDFDPNALSPDRSNVSLSRNLLPLARLLNRLTIKNVADKRCLVDIVPSHRIIRALLAPLNRMPFSGGVARAADLLDAETIADIRRRFASGNARLAAERSLELARHGYPMEESRRT